MEVQCEAQFKGFGTRSRTVTAVQSEESDFFAYADAPR
jgi:hypothetical protein